MKKVIILAVLAIAWWAGPAAAQTATPTATATATATATNTATATATNTATATASASPTPVIFNILGPTAGATPGAPVPIAACTAGATQVILGGSNTTWTLMCEADCRCLFGDAQNHAPVITPTATLGFLFKAGIYINESSLGLGSAVVNNRMDCCGVSGATNGNTWQE